MFIVYATAFQPECMPWKPHLSLCVIMSDEQPENLEALMDEAALNVLILSKDLASAKRREVFFREAWLRKQWECMQREFGTDLPMPPPEGHPEAQPDPKAIVEQGASLVRRGGARGGIAGEVAGIDTSCIACKNENAGKAPQYTHSREGDCRLFGQHVKKRPAAPQKAHGKKVLRSVINAIEKEPEGDYTE